MLDDEVLEIVAAIFRGQTQLSIAEMQHGFLGQLTGNWNFLEEQFGLNGAWSRKKLRAQLQLYLAEHKGRQDLIAPNILHTPQHPPVAQSQPQQPTFAPKPEHAPVHQ